MSNYTTAAAAAEKRPAAVLRLSRFAAGAAATGLLLFACFQASLALGAPWADAAWGGGRDALPPSLRIASAFAVVFLVVAAAIVLGRAGYWGRDDGPFGVFRWGTWALVVVLILSGLANVASSSAWERFLNGPVGLLLGLLCLIVAVGCRRRRLWGSP